MSGNTQTNQAPPIVIPDKLFFKIGEVCELVGVQAHVLRYWESEFAQLQPQKNRAGQRTYRRKDVEMAMRIRELLYVEGFTIAGAKKKLSGGAGPTRLKVVSSNGNITTGAQPPPPVMPPPPPPPPEKPARELAGSPLPQRSLSRDTLLRLKLMAEEMLTSLRQDD